MKTAVELRAEAQRMRTFALSVDDPGVVAEIHAMIAELERRARPGERHRPLKAAWAAPAQGVSAPEA